MNNHNRAYWLAISRKMLTNNRTKSIYQDLAISMTTRVDNILSNFTYNY